MIDPLDNLLKNSLIAIYYDDPMIVQAIDKLDFSKVNHKFKSELYERIDKETFSKVDSFLRSEDYANYKKAIDGASLAATRELGDLMNFVYSQKQGDVN